MYKYFKIQYEYVIDFFIENVDTIIYEKGFYSIFNLFVTHKKFKMYTFIMLYLNNREPCVLNCRTIT